MPGTLTILMGLPGSGKTHFAEEARQAAPSTAIVSKDTIRQAFSKLGVAWDPRLEIQKIIPEEERIITSFLHQGLPVIVDSTNFAHESRLRRLAAQCGVPCQVTFINTPLEECIARDLARPETLRVGESKIRRMADQFTDIIFDHTLVPANNDPDLPDALICDLDGTLALLAPARVPGDYTKADQDPLNIEVAHLVRRYYAGAHPTNILIVTGREERWRPVTLAWLKLHGISFDHLLMRPAGNTQRDTLVKLDLFNNHIRGRFHIYFVLEDRTRIVKMWRALGLTCFQVAEGDY